MSRSLSSVLNEWLAVDSFNADDILVESINVLEQQQLWLALSFYPQNQAEVDYISLFDRLKGILSFIRKMDSMPYVYFSLKTDWDKLILNQTSLDACFSFLLQNIMQKDRLLALKLHDATLKQESVTTVLGSSFRLFYVLPHPLSQAEEKLLIDFSKNIINSDQLQEIKVCIGEEESKNAEQRILEFEKKTQDLRKKMLIQLKNTYEKNESNVPPSNSSTFANSENKLGNSSSSENFEFKKQKWQRQVDGLVFGKFLKDISTSPISELNKESGLVQIKGELAILEEKLVKNNTYYILNLTFSDETGAFLGNYFVKPESYQKIKNELKVGDNYCLQAEVFYDHKYLEDLTGKITALAKIPPREKRKDLSVEKRIELHCHSRMSAQDAIPKASDIVSLAHSFGHEAVAITDHGVVQSFPEAYETAVKLEKSTGRPIKLILGMEGYMIDDGPTIVYGNQPFPENFSSFVAFDLETTGLSHRQDRIIEIGACRFVRDELGYFSQQESFQCLVNPELEISSEITQLTGITNEMIKTDGIPVLQAIQQFADFVKDSPLVGHNVLFDLGFLRQAGFATGSQESLKIKFNQLVIDTVTLAKTMWEGLPNYRLNTVCEYLDIPLEKHHRALEDALASGQILQKVFNLKPDWQLDDLNKACQKMPEEDITKRQNKPNHIILLAENTLGLYNLYRLVSESHVRYFNFRPRLPKSLIAYYKAGLTVSGACVDGDIFKYVIAAYEKNNHDFLKTQKALQYDRVLKEKTRFYDYIEIQPLTNNGFLYREQRAGITKPEQLIELNKLMLHLGKVCNVPVCATCDAHFLNKEDLELRAIIQASLGFKDLKTSPLLYFRSTDEMLAEFSSYLDEETVHEIVIKNPQTVASRITENLKPFPAGSFPPMIETAESDVRRLTWQNARELYDMTYTEAEQTDDLAELENKVKQNLPPIVRSRIEKELKSIIDNGFAIMYYIAHKVVKQSNDDGFIVGSRGSVGSSLVATLCGITEVNPLEAHYLCPRCRHSEFMKSGEYGSGYDLPEKNCPHCRIAMQREGQDIPFETFLGFHGDKQPDIDLNFSGEYQARAHAFITEMFGENYTFRAGTIGAFAEKNAFALVKKYAEQENLDMTKATMLYKSLGLVGVKKTSGQHPGGIVVIPKERDIYEFTPIQYPANKLDASMTTTHFDFNMLHDTILKLDVLGHDDPTMLTVLGRITGVDVRQIPIPDQKVMSLFHSTKELSIPDEESIFKSATLGLPEMGTFMAREMIKETKPTKFFDLVQLMGLSHGTDVWKGNAQELIRNKICTINDVIGCRDSIMTTLIYWGIPSKDAFDIMERVRKGKGLSPEQEKIMIEKKVPDWYIDSCKKIKYMFPKAHAVAYLISALRIAWFKVYYPEAYYATYFTVRADEFDAAIMCGGLPHLQNERQRLLQIMRTDKNKKKEERQYYIAELGEEMYQRKISFLPIDLFLSEATDFKVEGKGQIRPPLNAISGISDAVAIALAKERMNGEFKSQTELMQRTGIGSATLQILLDYGLLNDLPKDNQMDLFSFMN